jgi:hypothetical protein
MRHWQEGQQQDAYSKQSESTVARKNFIKKRHDKTSLQYIIRMDSLEGILTDHSSQVLVPDSKCPHHDKRIIFETILGMEVMNPFEIDDRNGVMTGDILQ